MKLYAGTKESWNAFVAANGEDGGVLQSWEWGEFEVAEGHVVHRLSFEHDGAIVGLCLLVERRLPFGLKYLYAPRGPVVVQNHRITEAQKQFFDALVQFAREQGVVFLRVEPPYEQLPVTRYPLRVTKPIQPQQTLCVNLTKSEDEILSAMHEKTRYNVRLAERHGVRIENSKSEILNPKQIQNSKFKTFFTLLQETARRDGFVLHSEEHYKKLLQIPYCLLLTAYYQDTPLATALVAFFGATAYYLHGASTSVHREVMAPYALHFAIMLEAKRRGCTRYDLWGVDEQRWPGVTRFKRGFAPDTPIMQYAGTFDIPIRKSLYTMYRLWKLFR
ncbi:peptidoglycan bridge formation glycyltransferase FemA/FemB family protein [Candidatus Uhrbacteria bacterium]|nr:peptidoglycan bridge formation glycyltransferase FemA/FemB family protein [Candidatus Uhrbacteria bacterium]